MAVKLTDKEVSALAKKMADKQQKINCKKKDELAKTKLPEAKKLIAVLNTLPDKLLEHLYSKRYNRGSLTAAAVAAILIDKEECACEVVDQKTFEADVVLAAHDCTTMAALCKKLDL